MGTGVDGGVPAHVLAGVEGLRAARALVRAPHGGPPGARAASHAPAPSAASALPFYDILACINTNKENIGRCNVIMSKGQYLLANNKTFVSPCLRMCFLKLELSRNLLPQVGHEKGRSSVCVSPCLRRDARLLNALLHSLQANFFSSAMIQSLSKLWKSLYIQVEE